MDSLAKTQQSAEVESIMFSTREMSMAANNTVSKVQVHGTIWFRGLRGRRTRDLQNHPCIRRIPNNSQTHTLNTLPVAVQRCPHTQCSAYTIDDRTRYYAACKLYAISLIINYIFISVVPIVCCSMGPQQYDIVKYNF